MLSRYTSWYLEKDIRTVNTLKHEDYYEIPSLLLCSAELQLATFNCYRYQPMHPKIFKFCHNEYPINTEMWYMPAPDTWLPGRYLGDGCYAIDFNNTKVFHEKLTSLQIVFNSSSPTDKLFIQALTPEELENKKRLTFLSKDEFVVYFLKGSYSLILYKTSVTQRLKAPYASNCSSNADVFSKVQTRTSCKETCAFNYVYEKCRDVPDGWKKQLEEQGLDYGEKDYNYNATRSCLIREVQKAIRGTLINCTCQDPCHEVVYSWSYAHLAVKNFWHIVLSGLYKHFLCTVQRQKN